MTKRWMSLLLLALSIPLASPARADVVSTIRDANGHYVRGAASLSGSDCSGLASVAQNLAMGRPIRRLGNTRSLIAGQWPDVVAGASESDRFILAANYSHMVVRVDGIGIEATTSGQPYRIGPSAASVFDSRFPYRFHVPENLLVA